MPPASVDEEVLPDEPKLVLITGGMELTGAGTVLLGMSLLGMLQVTMVRGIGPKAIHSQRLLQMTRRRLRLLLQMISPALGVLGFSSQKAVVLLLLLMLLHRLQMTASGACRKCPLLQMMTLLLKSRFWWKPP